MYHRLFIHWNIGEVTHIWGCAQVAIVTCETVSLLSLHDVGQWPCLCASIAHVQPSAILLQAALTHPDLQTPFSKQQQFFGFRLRTNRKRLDDYAPLNFQHA